MKWKILRRDLKYKKLDNMKEKKKIGERKRNNKRM